MKIIIVGGVAGGASTATRLRRMNEKAEILILERGRVTAFDTPAALERNDPSFREVLALSGLTST